MVMTRFIGQRATTGDKTGRLDRYTRRSVLQTVVAAMTFPFVRSRVERGEMELHGAYFGVAEGSLFVLDPDAKEFRSVSAAA